VINRYSVQSGYGELGEIADEKQSAAGLGLAIVSNVAGLWMRGE
jgi:hypothetical protein